MKPLQYESLSNQAYESLKNHIIYRQVAPGEKLDIKELAKELDVSRGPVSEAFTRLEAEGLIERRNRVGTFVTPLTRPKLEEMFLARSMVESWITKPAIKHLQEEDINHLQLIIRKAGKLFKNVSEKSFDYLTFSKYDHQFHLALVELCGNSEIVRFYESLNSHVQIARVYSLKALKRSKEGQAEHKNILEAFAKKDMEKAKEAQRKHLENSKGGILKIIEKVGEL